MLSIHIFIRNLCDNQLDVISYNLRLPAQVHKKLCGHTLAMFWNNAKCVFAHLIALSILVSSCGAQESCVPRTREELKEMMVRSDEFNRRFMADTYRDAVVNFPDLADGYTVVAQEFSCTGTCFTKSLKMGHAFAQYLDPGSIEFPPHSHKPPYDYQSEIIAVSPNDPRARPHEHGAKPGPAGNWFGSSSASGGTAAGGSVPGLGLASSAAALSAGGAPPQAAGIPAGSLSGISGQTVKSLVNVGNIVSSIAGGIKVGTGGKGIGGKGFGKSSGKGKGKHSGKNPTHGIKRRRRQTDDVPGSVLWLSCIEAGNEDEPGYRSLCGACSAIRELPESYYPRFLNQVICGKGTTECLKGNGQCVEKTLNFHIMKNNGNADCPDWRKEEISLPVCCECMLHSNSGVFAE